MKKIILLLSISLSLSGQAMAYSNDIVKDNPIEMKKVESSFTKYVIENNPELNNIYIKLSKQQQYEFLNYTYVLKSSTDKLISISVDKNLLVTNDVLNNKITIDETYLDYRFNKSYPEFVKSYFTLLSIIKTESPELFKKNIENAEKIANRKNKENSYYAHLEEVKKEILQFVIDGKKMADVSDFIKSNAKQEQKIFRDSIQEKILASTYFYVKRQHEVYKNTEKEERKSEILNKLNNKTL